MPGDREPAHFRLYSLNHSLVRYPAFPGRTIILHKVRRHDQGGQLTHQTGDMMRNTSKDLRSGMFMTAILLGALVVGCSDSTSPRNLSPTVPGAGTGSGAGGRGPAPVTLGAAGNYVILAKTGISSVPTSAITGHLGISPAAASFITGFSLNLGAGAAFSTSTQVTGNVYAPGYAAPTPANLTAAISAMETAYTNAAGRTSPDHTELASGNIGGLTLPAGLYKWSSTVTIPQNVTLTGNANDVWIFQIAGGLTQASAKRVVLAGGALASNVFWQVAGVVTIGTTAHMEGQVLSQTAISLGTGASANGRLLAQTAVTLASSTVVVQ